MEALEWTIIEVLAGILTAIALAWGSLIWAKIASVDRRLAVLIKELNEGELDDEARLVRLETVCAILEGELTKLRQKCPVVSMSKGAEQQEHG